MLKVLKQELLGLISHKGSKLAVGAYNATLRHRGNDGRMDCMSSVHAASMGTG